MTEHELVSGLLPRVAAGALDPGEQQRVDQHLATCESCRASAQVWQRYAGALQSLPQPALPLGLLERTRARVLEQREAAAARKREAWKLAGLVGVSWASSFVTWGALRMITGGSLTVLGANLLNGATWVAVSTVFAWMTAASAAVMLGKQSPQMERSI